ncbi:MAG: transposase [Armatimonadetes bacterium]|nr:transposase [Armatimonadota bacterium]
MQPGKRVTINAPGHAHQLTFSCFKRLPILNDDFLRSLFLTHLDEARTRHDFDLWAYVLMPEHVHLLLRPRQREYSIERIRSAIKGGFAREALAWLKVHKPKVEAKLVLENGKKRYWQDGKGHDRNLWTPPAIWSSIRYIHGNPVKRKLAETPLQWEWSSARFYEGFTPVAFQVDRCPVEPPNCESGVWEQYWEPE